MLTTWQHLALRYARLDSVSTVAESYAKHRWQYDVQCQGDTSQQDAAMRSASFLL